MASAVSQQADGCFVLKASEPSCGTASEPPPPDAAFDVFCNRKIPEKALIMEGVDETAAAAAAEPSEVEDLRRELEAMKALVSEKDGTIARLTAQQR